MATGPDGAEAAAAQRPRKGRRKAKSQRKLERRIRELNAAGWSDREIARRMRCSATRVRKRRMSLGLPSNGHNKRHTAKLWATRLRTLKRDGVRSLAGMVELSRKLRAAASGWPPDTGRREVEILNLLDRVGPKSKNEIANLLGLRHLRSGGERRRRSYLRALLRAGLVESSREMSPYGPARRLYAVSTAARRARAMRMRAGRGLVPAAATDAATAGDSPDLLDSSGNQDRLFR